MNSSTGTAAT